MEKFPQWAQCRVIGVGLTYMQEIPIVYKLATYWRLRIQLDMQVIRT